jgi:hypothetical protein
MNSNSLVDLEGLLASRYPGAAYWPLDWDNDFQLRGRLLSYRLKEMGFRLRYPTTHFSPRIVAGFGEEDPDGAAPVVGLRLASSWFIWGDEIVSATDGVVVEAGWHGNRDGVGHRIRVKTTAPDGRDVLVRYAPMAGYDGIYAGIGDTVEVGQKLGRPGAIGVGTSDYLHIDVEVGGALVDPALLIEWPDREMPTPGSAHRAFPMGDDGATSRASVPKTHIRAKTRSSNMAEIGGDVESEVVSLPAAVLIPKVDDIVERLDWRIAAAIGAPEGMSILGQPLDTHLSAPWGFRLLAVNPTTWGERLPAWVRQQSDTPQKALGREELLRIMAQLLPGRAQEKEPEGEREVSQARPYRNASQAECRTVNAETPWEMAIQLLPPLDGDIALAQTDSRWASYDFGEHPGQDSETIGRYGCFLTALAIILRKIYGREVVPPVLDKLLVAARAAYIDDNIMAWNGAVPLFPVFDDEIKDNRVRSARELERLMSDGWEIVLRRADGGHFVYLETVEGDVLHIIDTWDGVRKQKRASNYAGIRAAHLRSGPAPAPSAPHKLLVGVHDLGGGEWMVRHGIEGCCLVHYGVQRDPIPIDCSHLQDAGITVVCRLNWGYAGGAGTLPRPADKAAFIDAVVETMVAARGVDYFHVGNEPNNRQEWPGFGSNDEFELTSSYVVDIYNEIWHRVRGRARMGPPPLDPYFGPNSNNREWWVNILNDITGADALFLHAKTQTNDPAEVLSRERFAHDPLRWQYLHLRTVETALDVVPQRFDSLPIFVTELNPQHKREIGGSLGWVRENAEWIRAAVSYFREEQPVDGVMLYRFDEAGDQAPFGLASAPALLNTIVEATNL